jgi:hypothetical protein
MDMKLERHNAKLKVVRIQRLSSCEMGGKELE